MSPVEVISTVVIVTVLAWTAFIVAFPVRKDAQPAADRPDRAADGAVR